MKTEFDFDPSQSFDSRGWLRATVRPMDFPFLILNAFGERRPIDRMPESLSVVLAKCSELIAANTTNHEHLREMVQRCLKAGDSKAGVCGLGNLSLDELRSGRSHVNLTLPLLPNAKIQLRRFGDCLGIRTVNERDEVHEKLADILSRIVDDRGPHYLRRFHQRYSFRLTPKLKAGTGSTYVLDVQEELAAMDRYLPDIKWMGNKRLAADLGGDFTGSERTGVKVGAYGDAAVFARIVYERETDDPDWRLGKVRSTTATELAFGVGTGDGPQIEYFIRTTEPDSSFDPARMDIDYPREQGLLHDLARMLYAGLYQRGFQSAVENGNGHFIRFLRESVRAAV